MGKRKNIPYSVDELKWIKVHCTLPRLQALRKFCDKFGRSDIDVSDFNRLCKSKGWMTGRTGCYDKGSVPLNKGKKCPPGQGGNHPNARKTQFKLGKRQGVAVKLYKPIGTIRVSKDGYLEQKINDDLPLQARWRSVHLIRWEEINGPLPKKHCLKCLDGNRKNTDPDNWKCIPRAALRFLNGYWDRNYDKTPDELKPSVLALAQVKHAKFKAAKRNLGKP